LGIGCEVERRNSPQRFSNDSRLTHLHRIEEKHILSLHSGANAVASQYLFIDDCQLNSTYRRGNLLLLLVTHKDDFASLAEVIQRRFRKYAQITLHGRKSQLTDLVMIDVRVKLSSVCRCI